MDYLRQKALGELRELFNEPPCEYLPSSFISKKLPVDAAEIRRLLIQKKKNGMYGVIPEITKGGITCSGKEISDFYKDFFEGCSLVGLRGYFNLEVGLEGMALDNDLEYASRVCAKILNMYTYRCNAGEKVCYELHGGKLMSVVAYDGWTGIVDLREFIDGDKVIWNADHGNWKILEFVCEPDVEAKRIDYLDYRISLEYITQTAEIFGGITPVSSPESLEGIKYSDIGFVTKNRRMWCYDFNEIFEEMFDFDPSPYYPALFFDIGTETARLKAQFMDCRSSILKNGYIKAARDFASERDLFVVGGLIEPKLTSCSQTIGDALLSNSFAPAAVMDKAYLYGLNSIKIAAGAAYSFDCETVCGDMFKGYKNIDLDIAYKDSMHSLARGVNSLYLHSPSFEENNAPSLMQMFFGGESVASYSKFISRVQALLRGGKHVADIAMLYPIYSMHSSVYFYDCEVEGFEYPNTDERADYMNVINSISLYSGHDLTVLHPSTLSKHCHVNGGYLYLDNDIDKERFSILVLPSTSVISIKNLELIAEFYDCGGKIVATGHLPKHAIESTKEKDLDARVSELVDHIFGKDASDTSIMRDFCYNSNENGGEAYKLYRSITAADGTGMTKSSMLGRTLNSFGVSFDFGMSNMIRYESTGSLNTIYPVFKQLGLSSHLPSGGMVDHIHKKRDDIDIYYIINTTTLPVSSTVKLRGELSIEEWNPHTGKTKRLLCTYKSEQCTDGEVTFTEALLEIPSEKSTFLIGTPIL